MRCGPTASCSPASPPRCCPWRRGTSCSDVHRRSDETFMKRAIEVVRAGRWPREQRADTVTLLFDDRYRRRLRMLGDNGLDFLLDLIEPIVLHTGDGLKLEEGGFVEV